MKVTEHVEHLLRQGHKPKELVELGFPKHIITRVRRRLKNEKTVLEGKVPEGTADAESHPQDLTESSEKMAVIRRKLQSMASDLQKVDNLMRALSEVTVLMAAAQELGTYKRETCPYQKDGVCTLQTWTSQDEIPRGIGEPAATGDEKREWYIRPSPFYCAMCTAPLEDRINDVEDQTFDTPLWGARHRITCTGCGSKGWIAIRIKCTKCGRESNWGWWPEKE